MGLQRGFTLVELMIAVVVLGVMATIALPSFMDAVRKNRRSEAFAALSAVQQAQERWRADRTAYASAIANTAPAGEAPNGLGLAPTTASGYYALAIDAANGTGYTATATATTGTSQDSDGNCVRLRIRLAGGNLYQGSAPAGGDFDESAGNRCWSR